jgi:hypothetical protein
MLGRDSEFSAERVRTVLSILEEHGIAKSWQSPDVGLDPGHVEYSLAT